MVRIIQEIGGIESKNFCLDLYQNSFEHERNTVKTFLKEKNDQIRSCLLGKEKRTKDKAMELLSEAIANTDLFAEASRILINLIKERIKTRNKRNY